MTLQEESRLSFYSEIAEISSHKNVVLVQHRETKKVYVRKDLTVYDKNIYLYLMRSPSRYFPRIYQCIESDGTLILIEEYIQGQNLEEYLEEKGALSEQETVSIVLDICEALKLLHEQTVPIIHRDLKPSNILLDQNGKIRIVDFNAARNFDDKKDEDTVVIGTRHYAAPEQYGYAQTDARTDIYALGILMNKLLTGKYPSEELYGGKLGSIIQKCIAFDPDHRYQNISELQSAIRKNAPSCGQAPDKKPGHPHLPPGFRTFTLWKMILAVIGYAFILYFCLTLDVENADGAAVTGALLWAYRICSAAVGILWILFWFNYLDIHHVLPLMKKKATMWTGYLLYTFLIAFVVLIILTIIQAVLQ